MNKHPTSREERIRINGKKRKKAAQERPGRVWKKLAQAQLELQEKRDELRRYKDAESVKEAD